MPGRIAYFARLLTTSACVLAFGAGPAFAQREPDQAQAAEPPSTAGEIVIVGQRNSVVKGIDPLATLDRNTLDSIGATSMGDLLRVIKPLTQSADGGDPIFLLNGQRRSTRSRFSPSRRRSASATRRRAEW